MPNIEIKAKVTEFPNISHKFLSIPTEHQIDTYFNVPNGRLKMRTIEKNDKIESVLIPYLRNDTLGPKKSEYTFLYPNNTNEANEILTTMFGQLCVVDKIRQIFLIENVRIHFDEVKDLGKFIEFEAVYQNSSDEEKNRNFVNELLKEFNITNDQLIDVSYQNLILNHRP